MVLLLAAVPRLRALTDEEKKEQFLQSRGDADDAASPSASPHHKKHAEAEATPHHKHSPTPEADVTPHHKHHATEEASTDDETTPEPEVTPHHRHSPTPEADVTPHHKHHAAEPASTDEEATPEPEVTPHHKHSPTPEADVTPHHKHHAAEQAAAEEEETPARRHHHASPSPEPRARKHAHPQEEEEETPAPVHHQQTPFPTPLVTPIPRVTPFPEERQRPERTPGPQPYQTNGQTYLGAPVTPYPSPLPRAMPAPTPPPGPSGAQVEIEKEGLEQQGGFEPPPPPPPTHHHWWQVFGGEEQPEYHYLSKAVRDAIDRAPVARRRWRFIVVHNSGTRQGNAKIFDYYHRYVRKMPNGLAYHFVIGNGTSSGNGQIEIGNRWTKQLQGGHVHSDYLNNIALGICLVGDFNRDLPTKEQLGALDELIRYLRIRVGKIDRVPAIVKAHREINPPQWPTDCPGDKFPYHWLHERFD